MAALPSSSTEGENKACAALLEAAACVCGGRVVPDGARRQRQDSKYQHLQIHLGNFLSDSS